VPVEEGEQQMPRGDGSRFLRCGLGEGLLDHRFAAGGHQRDVSAECGAACGLELAEGQSDRGKRGAIELIGGVVSGRGVDAHKPGELIVLQEGEQQVIGSDSPVAAALRFISCVFDRGPGRAGESFKHCFPAFRTSRALTGG
jgi:hypothetical protein